MARPNYRLAGAALLLVLGALGCTTEKTTAPPLSGPSDVGTSLQIQVIPDTIVQDGASQSLVTVTAFGPNGQPLRSVPLRAEIEVAGAITDFGSLSARNIVTDTNGRATVTYTAPPPPPVFVDGGTIVSISMTASGSDFGNATPRVATIRLVPPGVIGPPPSPFRPDFTVPTVTMGDVAVFSASVLDAGGFDVTNQVASYSWNFGDGGTATGRNVSHTYDDSGTFSVSLTIIDGLGRRANVSHAVSVAPGTDPTPTIVVTPSSPNRGQTVTFNGSTSTATAGHRITDYSWDFGDGGSASGPIATHAYGSDGSYSVTLTVTDDAGRRKSTVTAVTVGVGLPTAAFSFSPSSPTTNQNVSFNASASSATAGRTIVSYAWDFDDGGTGGGVQTSHTYNLARSYTVRLTVTDSAGQTGTTTQTVTVTSGSPTAAFTFSPSSPLAGATVTFDASNSVAAVNRAIASYRWNFDDGSPVVTTANPQTTHVFATPGSYSVLLTVVDDAGQTGQLTRNVSVGNGSPTAAFTNSPTSPFAHQSVLFDGRSSTAAAGRTITAYAWAFGDGGTGTGATASHTYTAPGNYTVRLTVTDNAGQTGTTTSNVSIQGDTPTASFSVVTSPTPSGAPISFDATASTAVGGRTLTYSWNFGDPGSGGANIGAGATPSHTFATPGNYTVTLTVTDSAGQTNITTRSVNIS